jgi:hypothetical protein
MMGPLGVAVVGAVLIGMTLGVVSLLVRDRLARERFARHLERTLTKPTELREGDAELGGIVESVGDSEEEPRKGTEARPTELEAVVAIRLVECARHDQRGTSWVESSRSVAIRDFFVRLPGSGERVLVSPGNDVGIVAPELVATPTAERDERESTIRLLPGEAVIVSGALERAQSPRGGDYRHPPRAWRLRAAEPSGTIVIARASAVEGVRKSAKTRESRLGSGAGFLGIAMACVVVAHFLAFQLAGPVVIGTVSGSHSSTDSKTHRTSTLAEITYRDAAGAPHRLDRGYAYFVESPGVGSHVRVKYFPGIPGDSELLFDEVSVGALEMLGSVLGGTTLLMALMLLWRRAPWGEPRVFRGT